jgi:hypothetical protein
MCSFLLVLPGDCQACSCGGAPGFFTASARAEVVVRGKVLSYQSNSMEVEVREVFKGATQPAKIRIWGDNGMQCRPYVTQFPIGTEWVFAVSKEAGTPASDYVISVCGDFWVRAEKDTVEGVLTAKPETISLAAFRERFRAGVK